jgi:hypothetical protein
MTCELSLFAYVRESFLCSHNFLDCNYVNNSIEIDDKSLIDSYKKFVVSLSKILSQSKVINLSSLFGRKEKFNHHSG